MVAGKVRASKVRRERLEFTKSTAVFDELYLCSLSVTDKAGKDSRVGLLSRSSLESERRQEGAQLF